MVRLLLMASFALMALPEALTYKAKIGDTIPVQAQFTFALTVAGPEKLTSQLRASNAVLQIQNLTATRKGRRLISAGEGNTHRVDLVFDSAHVELRTVDKPHVFDFDTSINPATLASDTLKQLSWGLGMAPRNYTLGPLGEYNTAPLNDAQAEAMGVIIDPAVRLAPKPVNLGDQWTADWVGSRKQKQNDAFFRYSQTARLQEIVPGPSPRARISYTTTGRMEIPADKNPQQEETTLQAKGTILLDIATGTVVGIDAFGSISTNLKVPGLVLTRTMSAKY
jgi:hypothetical protein